MIILRRTGRYLQGTVPVRQLIAIGVAVAPA